MRLRSSKVIRQTSALDHDPLRLPLLSGLATWCRFVVVSVGSAAFIMWSASSEWLVWLINISLHHCIAASTIKKFPTSIYFAPDTRIRERYWFQKRRCIYDQIPRNSGAFSPRFQHFPVNLRTFTGRNTNAWRQIWASVFALDFWNSNLTRQPIAESEVTQTAAWSSPLRGEQNSPRSDILRSNAPSTGSSEPSPWGGTR